MSAAERIVDMDEEYCIYDTCKIGCNLISNGSEHLVVATIKQCLPMTKQAGSTFAYPTRTSSAEGLPTISTPFRT
jgi:hypothetical protein